MLRGEKWRTGVTDDGKKLEEKELSAKEKG